MNQPNSPVSTLMAVQQVEETTGKCHRQALWCGTHFSAWPHGQTPGCNDFTASVQAAETVLVASAKRGGR